MGWEFQGDNLVYKAPPEVAGYTWVPMGQNENGTNPEGTWVKNEGFNPSSLTSGKVDKYGRVDNSLKPDATEAEKRAYALVYGGANPNSEALQGTNAGNTNENLAWWNVDPALEQKAQAAHSASGGNALGMTSWRDYITPAAIIAGGLGAAYAAPASAALSPAWDAAFAYGGAGATGVGTGTAATGLLGGAGTVTSEVGQQAFFDALASGANSTEALNAAQAAQAAGAATTTGTMSMDELLGLTDQAAADANWEKLMAEYNQAGGYAGSYAPEGYGTANGYALGNASEIANFTGEVAAGALPQSTLSQLASIAKQYGPTVAKALLGSLTAAGAKAGTSGTGTGTNLLGGLLGAGANYALNQYQLGQLKNAYNENVAGQQAATQTAQQQASFKPVGITTAFGQSNFQFDPTTGQLTSAGYTPTSQVAGQVQNLFGLGAQALPTTANTQDIQNQYIAQQQGLLAPGREQQLAGINNQQWQTGRTGLATGGTMAGYAAGQPGLMQTNPELAAYYNSIGQQNAQIAANAPTYAQNLLNSQIATGTGLFGAANTLEGYAQAPLTLSSGLGTAGATAGAKAGYYGLLGNQSALATQLQGQQANIYGTGQALTTASQPLLNAANNAISEWLK